ncbi:MAG: hypothetical protein M3070_17645 [Actinomycetota bacterium]|nr:hypothetical protein [Actinomycetota bacterium]
MILGKAMLAVVAAGGAAIVPHAGTFNGKTSQRGATYPVTFRVKGSQVKGDQILWRAHCASHKILSRGTRQGSSVIRIAHGRWSNSGRYTAKLPYAKGMTGQFHVITNSVRFVTPDRARGTWRLKAVLYINAKRIDTCDTGRVTWTANRR